MGLRFDSQKKEKIEFLALMIKYLCITITHLCIVEVLFTGMALGIFTVFMQLDSRSKKFNFHKVVLGAFMLSSNLNALILFQ